MNISTLSSTLRRRWSLADTLALVTIVLFGITLYYAIDQTTIMCSTLALPLVTSLVGLTTFSAIITAILYSKAGSSDQ
jgi:hypothetical protein